MERATVTRRGFLRDCSLAGAGLLAGAVTSSGCVPGSARRAAIGRVPGSDRIRSQHSAMCYRSLGQTGLMVSRIVLSGQLDDAGEGYWRRAFTDGEVPPETVERRTAVVSRCLDRGINLLDITCGAQAMAHRSALKGRRDRLHIAADDAARCMRHLRHRNAASQMRNIDACLSKLGTDYLDIWRPQFKRVGGHRDMETEVCTEVFETARKQGKVRFLGVATHDYAWIDHVIDQFPQYTVIFAPYAPGSTTGLAEGESVDAEGSLFEKAKARRIGVIATIPCEAGEVPGDVERGGDSGPVRTEPAGVLDDGNVSALAVKMLAPSDVDEKVRVLLGGDGVT